MAIPHITQAKLKELMDYDPETGVFTWKVKPAKQIQIGDVAGCTSDGYVKIRVLGVLYQAHRLAWLYVHGTLPHRIDHRDGDGTNNRHGNLRECTQAQNMANTKKHKRNTSGYKGVSWNKDAKKWTAKISINWKMKHLGYFETAELAHEFYCLAADMLHGEFSNHGVHKCES